MSRKTPLSRYRAEQVSRKELLEGAWRGTHPDYRSVIKGVRTVMYRGGLEPLADLPAEELRERYVRAERKHLQETARASDLGLYELNPDEPERSILFADSEILFKAHGRWNLGYVQPANFNEHALLKASKYAQVVAALHPEAASEDLLSMLRDPKSYGEWLELERKGLVRRDEDGQVTSVG
jgi:hypothetical protein